MTDGGCPEGEDSLISVCFISSARIVASFYLSFTSNSTSKGINMMLCSFPILPFPLDLVEGRFLGGATEVDASSSKDASSEMALAFLLADLLGLMFCGGLFSSISNVKTDC